MNIDQALLDQVVKIAINAGDAVMEVYGREYSTEDKDDKSPLTEADLASNRVIVAGLKELELQLPILSEEMKAAPYSERESWTASWLVDPLDGTKEFIKRNGQFTVNIALIDNGVPILGVVHAPAIDTTYFAAQGLGAFKSFEGETKTITTAPAPSDLIRVVASASHAGPETESFLQSLASKYPTVELVSMGSSLKLCLVAEGAADLYPRLGPTMEWDTGAAQAVAELAGATVTDTDGNRIVYNRENLLNSWFIVCGNASIPWQSCLG